MTWGWVGEPHTLEQILITLSVPHVLSPLGTFFFFQVKSGKNEWLRAALEGKGIHTLWIYLLPCWLPFRVTALDTFLLKTSTELVSHQAGLLMSNP